MRTIALLCLIPALLGGCAVYTVNNEKFYNIDDAMTAVRRGQDDVLKGIPERSKIPRPKPNPPYQTMLRWCTCT